MVKRRRPSRSRSKRSGGRRHRSFRRKKQTHPVILGIALIVASIIIFRFSIASVSSNPSEASFWIALIGIGLFIGGLLVLIAWWRNNVVTMNTKHAVNWKNG